MRAPRDFLIAGFYCADSGCVNYLLKLYIDKLIEGKKNQTGRGRMFEPLHVKQEALREIQAFLHSFPLLV